MALFKIFKGTEVERLTNPSHPNYVPLNSGYCYFDTTTGLFFIDAENSEGELIRAPINANKSIFDINGNQIDTTYAQKNHGIYYGTCSTAAATAEKAVTLADKTGFELVTGAVVFIKFNNINSANSPTLNVEGTGAKPIYRYGTTAISTGTTTSGWQANSVQMFVYDGANWIRDYWYNSTYSNASLGQGYVTCTTAESTIAKVGTLSSYSLITGGIVSVKFTNAVPANATLNINNKGAKNIFYKGAAISSGIIKAGDIVTFIYSGQEYQLISIDRWQNDINNIINNINDITAQVRQNADDISITRMDLSDFSDTLIELFGYMYASDWDINNIEGPPPSIREIAEDVATEAVKNKVDKIDGKGLSTNDYTTAEKNKLSGIAANAEVNQNAFSNVVVGSTTISADTKTDTLTIAAGTGISVSGDAINDKVTITNAGVRAVSTGTANGTISVNTNGTSTNVAVKGLGSAAYTNTNAYDAAGAAAAAESAAKAYADEIKNDLLALEEDVDNKAPINHTHLYAGSTTAGGPANSVGHTLNFTVGGIYKGAFNGAEDKFIDVNAVDLNISSALSFLGIVGTAPTSATVTLLDGTVKTAVNGSVVILQSNGVEYFFDGSAWTALGAGESYAIADHEHGNITNEGYLSNSPNRVVITGADGAIKAMAAGSNDQVLKMVNGVPAWGTASFTDNKVTNTLATTTKAYITGTTSATTNTGGQVFDTGVYLDTVAGQLTATTLKSNKLIVGTTSAAEHIKFNREGYNYIVAPKNGVIAFSPGTNTTSGATSGAGAKLAVTIESVIPGQNDNAVSLGNPTYKWRNVYSYMFTGDLTGNATSADQLTTIAAGTSTLPVYFSDGIPHACSTTSPLTVNISGNAGSATKLSKSINISLDGDVVTVDGNSVTTNGANDITITTKLANNYSLDTHTHGYIARNGTISTNATISTGDSLIIADSSANNIIAKSSITFTAGSKKYLSEGGTWEEIDVKGGVSYGSGSWTQGTSAGPVLNLKDELGNTQLTLPAIPTATSSASGIITTGDQTFAGSKTFNNNIKLNNNLLLTSAKTYGKEFPTTNLTEGQIFFQILPSNEYDVPAGGTQGQILTKITDTDYDCNWTSPKIDGVALSASGSTTHYGVCSTAAATAAKTVDIPGFSLVVGAKVTVKFTYANSVASPTLNVSGTGAKPMYRYGTTAMSTSTSVNGWVAGAVQTLVYDGTGWIREYWANTTYYNPIVQITTAAATAAKVGSTSAFSLEAGKHFVVWVLYDNTAASALTLNIADTGAKPIYINGIISSSSNYTLPKGQYLVAYDGTNYCFFTEGTFGCNGLMVGGNIAAYSNIELTGQINKNTYSGGAWIQGRNNAALRTSTSVDSSSFSPIISAKTQLGSWDVGPCHPMENFYFSYATDTNFNAGTNSTMTSVYIKNNGVIMGAGWNDYAEFRETQDYIEAGRVVIENGDDTLSLSTKRLQPGAEIVSDTYGFAIGQNEKCNTPVAATGRVLAYPHEDKNMFKAGQPVCSGPNGTVSVMTDEEARNYPWCIIGTVSAIPTYDTWGEDNVPVNGRIWIRIR